MPDEANEVSNEVENSFDGGVLGTYASQEFSTVHRMFLCSSITHLANCSRDTFSIVTFSSF